MLSLLLLLTASVSDDSTYWQQRVAYAISASLAESSGVLTGKARIKYVNQSPDTLHDFNVHQYLNAFRPGSRWAAADSAEDRVRFQHLKDPDYAFERITAANVMGETRRPDYPYAPDSTIAHWSLPRPLAPGDSFEVEIDWQARPSTVPRRQGRQGRRFDFAQWYPKVVVYDKYGWQDHPLYPGGEFYGEFASYDVTLDLATDQVIGATGVPIAGDPGWERANANPTTPIDYQRDWYRRAAIGRTQPDGRYPIADSQCTAPGRKCVRFYADSVHHFAFSLNPEYRYEEGRYKDVAVRVLYQPGDSATWGGGIAVRRTVTALAWLDTLYGKFAWPQITNVHRIEGGGTEFPMMVMNGGAGLGLILHEVGHNYTMGILANNEWREGWLDEGFTSFQTGWYFETHGAQSSYPAIEANILFWDLERWSEPISMVSDQFRDFMTYNTMIYTKAQLFYEQLRYVVGDDVMRRILRTYYARWRLRHVDEAAFRDVAEEVSHMDLKWLFGQWLQGTPLIDYRLDMVERHALAKGRWRTVVTISRLGDGRMPIEIGDGDEVFARASGQPEQERVEFITDHEPGRLVLDPRLKSHDWNALNNREIRPFIGRAARLWGWDDPTQNPARRDRIVTAFLPLVWRNDFAGTTAALKFRENYLGRFDRNLLILSWGLGPAVTNRLGFYARISDPVRHPLPRTEASFAAWSVEGRGGLSLHTDRSLRNHLGFGADRHAGFDLLWMTTTDLGYLDRSLWDDAGTIEIGPWYSTASRRETGIWRARLGARAGLVYRFPGLGIISKTRYDIEGFGRFIGEASVRKPFWLKTALGVRLFAGWYVGDKAPPRQRRIPVAGADPYETFTNPLLRSRGALFVHGDLNYHAPGNANLRGFARDLGGRWAAALNFENTRTLFRRGGGLFADAAFEVFADAGMVDSRAVPSPAGRSYTPLYDAGVGFVTRHRIHELAWTMRLEFPLYVNRVDFAADANSPKDGHVAFRWLLSLEPSF